MTPICQSLSVGASRSLRLGRPRAALAATYGDLSGAARSCAACPIRPAPMPPPPAWRPVRPRCRRFSGGPEGVLPAPLDAPGAASLPSPWTSPTPNLPLGRDAALPHGRLQVWSFGQVNSTTDPFNAAGLSTPFMFVPWSTPLSGWTNAQTWNWWRERAGVQPPYW